MAWGRVDDNLMQHPKVLALGRDRHACMGLWLDGLCYANRNLTDGFVPLEALPARSARRQRRLVDVGLWEPAPGGYQMHDFADYNPTREKVLKNRAANLKRVKNYRRRQVDNDEGDTKDDGFEVDQPGRNAGRNAITAKARNAVVTPFPAQAHSTPTKGKALRVDAGMLEAPAPLPDNGQARPLAVQLAETKEQLARDDLTPQGRAISEKALRKIEKEIIEAGGKPGRPTNG